MTWSRRSSIVLLALALSGLAGCSDDTSTQGPRPDLDMPDAGSGCGDCDGGTQPDASASFVVNAEAHWVTRSVIAVPADMTGERFELHYAADGGITLDGRSLAGSMSITLTVDAAGVPEAVKTKFPHLTSYKALTIAAADAGKVSDILRGQMVLVGADAGGAVQAATSVQTPGVLDDLYPYDGALGVTFAGTPAEIPTFRLWAPTARNVSVAIYDPTDKTEIASQAMTRDDATGVWSYTAADDAWYGNYYQYKVEVFAPRANPGDMTTAPGELVTNLVTDPYSLGVSTNSAHSLIVNLDDDATKPTGWNAFTPPDNFEQPEDIVLYEVHVRDFSVADETVAPEHRGKYLAFTYDGTTRPLSDGMAHLDSLATTTDTNGANPLQGITHVHLLPVFDIATIDEKAADRIDIDVAGSVGLLCEALDDIVPAVNCAEDGGSSLRDALQALLDASGSGENTRGDTEEIQAVVDSARGLDGFNWGYDPFHYTAPEGSYATDPEGMARIREFREMVMGLGAIELRTVMDVVYNHTNASGQNDRSVLDKIVPGYYHRQNPVTGGVEQSTCCENTATEHAMMEKLMIDSVKTWVTQYKIAGFRFDLMGHHMKSNMEKVRAALVAIDPKIYVYGEGWDFGEVVSGARGENATQGNLAGTGIGTFSDRLRDGVRGGGPFDNGNDLRKKQGFVNGMFYDPNELNTDSPAVQRSALLDLTDLINLGMAANLEDFVLTNKDGLNVVGADIDYNGYAAGYALDPQEIITYVEAHDNQTLFDSNQYKIPTGRSMDDRVRMQNLALSIDILAQGIPFMQMGQDILRSKSMARDSYDYGDWFNEVDFSYPDNASATNNWNVGLPPKEKDEAAYPVIKELIADDSIDPRAEHMQRAHDHVREMLRIRRESRLFRLQTGAEVKTRVDFHNVGPDQKAGLIVMTITDGACAGADLDPDKNNVAVLINATDATATFAIAGTALEGTQWSLHRVIEEGTDPSRSQMSFSSTLGVFSVPARSTAVFVDIQGAAQDPDGLCNTREPDDAPPPPPAGDLTADVFVRGTITDPAWDTLTHKFAKAADNRYEVVVPGLAAGPYKFKVASENWSTYNWGGMAGEALADGGSITLTNQGQDIDLNIATTGDYKFILDTTNLMAPELSLQAQ
ncbi:MAG TPA: pullulanase-type alpha-1,6-glucosidase [Haliangium sp.]|nr:pullulanase-type alpha-1,6-glucosidase [Haliangium sp.]